MKHILKWIGITAGLLLLAIPAIVIGMYLHWRGLAAKPITGADGKAIQGSVSEMGRITLGGLRQTIYIRGHDRTKPVILFLHGGPGSPEFMMMKHFNKGLEKDYVVVNWDQRGAGKSFSPCVPRGALTVRHFVTDTIELTQYLRKRFRKEKIYLVGHSWGTLVGVHAVSERPDLYHAYIGIGQVVDLTENERLSWAYALDQARRRGDRAAVEKLEAARDYWVPSKFSITALMTQRQYLLKYGGVLHGRDNYDLLFSVPIPEEFGPFDIAPLLLGSVTSLARIWPGLLDAGSLEDTHSEFRVPVYFFTGAHDYNVPFALTERYFKKVKSPRKAMVWFGKSGHMPNYEEPEKFMDELRKAFR